METFQASVCDRARKEVVIGLALLIVTMGAFVLFFVLNYLRSRALISQYLPTSDAERVAYNLIFAVFMYGSFAYQVSRLAFFWNVQSRVEAARRNMSNFLARSPNDVPHVEIIVPSYKEEVNVIWQTLMSAALVDYADRSIVLLIDNPPNPSSCEDVALLNAARSQIQVVRELLAPLASEFSSAASAFRATAKSPDLLGDWAEKAASLYDQAAQFLSDLAVDVRAGKFGGVDDHAAKFFVDRILLEPAEEHRQHARALRDAIPTHATLLADFSQLEQMFKVRLSSFERKQFVNLSQVSTKAANLNSYISLMGRDFDVVPGEAGQMLVERANQDASSAPSLSFADAPYIVILDADSFLLRNYLTCMISAQEDPANSRVAVMQTPYTSIPNTPHPIERAAAATTDIYYYVTEGMSFAGAGSWIGAAAAIRKAALADIRIEEDERGFKISTYIQDQTVIEDTGATIDLACKDWTVQNYPARLSYSATPSDFGALVVQRRRWSNGGLIILPSVLRYLMSKWPTPRNILEGLLRIHYMIMPACISTSMLAILLYPFDFKRVSSWIYLTLPPYLYLVCRDLKQTGYRRSEFFKAYTLFLLLLPVVLSGVKNSIFQIVYGTKTGFGRTPKIIHRTAAPAMTHLAILGLFGWSIWTAYHDLSHKNELHAIFAVSNAVALGYGIIGLIGLREMMQDLALPLHAAVTAIKHALGRRSEFDKELVASPSLQPSLTASVALLAEPSTTASDPTPEDARTESRYGRAQARVKQSTGVSRPILRRNTVQLMQSSSSQSLLLLNTGLSRASGVPTRARHSAIRQRLK